MNIISWNVAGLRARLKNNDTHNNSLMHALFSQKLEKKQRLIMAISNPKLVKNSDFNILYQFEWYIHKSLTRYIVVMEKN